MFKSIVVAVDGSDPSKRAVEAACTLAKAFSSEVHLIHALENKVVEVMPGRATGHGANDDPDSMVLAAAVEQANQLGVQPASKTVGEGDSFEEIMTIAGLYSADLIVTGRRGLGGISGLFAGSTSQQIAKHADCAFLSIK